MFPTSFLVEESGCKAIVYSQSYLLLFDDSPMADFQLPINTINITRNTNENFKYITTHTLINTINTTKNTLENFKYATTHALRNKRMRPELLSPLWRCDLTEINIVLSCCWRKNGRYTPQAWPGTSVSVWRTAFVSCQRNFQLDSIPYVRKHCHRRDGRTY